MKRVFLLIFILVTLASLNCLADEPKVTLIYADQAQVELVSPQGVRVLIDICMPFALSKPATKKDILLTTHEHADHIFRTFEEAFTGPKLTCKAGTIHLGDVRITGISGEHNDVPGDRWSLPGSNIIFVIEMAGLRIVHFGDLGQKELRPEQLEALGKVDVVVMQFANPLSTMGAENLKGFRLMEQVRPGLIIPTHMDLECVRIASERWEACCAQGNVLRIGRSSLGEKTRFALMGENARFAGAMFDLPLIDWSK